MSAAAPRRKNALRTLFITVGLLAALILLGFASLVLFFPADQLRAQFERRVSDATGYTVTVRELKLGWAGFGVALTAENLQAVSRDGSQTLRAPEAVLRVALGPLLRRQVVLTKASVQGAVFSMGPPTRAPVESPVTGGTGGNGQSGAFVAPKIEIRNSRIIQEGTSGTTTFHGVQMNGAFRLAREDRSTASGPSGLFKGSFSSDSTSFAPRATPEAPLRLPAIDLRFQSRMQFAPQSASTAIEGRWGEWPGKGTIESVFDPELKGWKNSGQFTLESIDLEKLSTFTEAAGPVLKAYALRGKLEDGRIHFETRPDRQEVNYDVMTRLSGISASLPDKGEVVRNGRGEIHIQPENLNFKGEFAMGRASLNVDAHVTEFAAPKWTAEVSLKGPAEEAFRFLPPGTLPEATGGRIDADIHVAGQVGQTGLPQATGTVRIEEVSLRHPALAVPVDRLDLTATLLWNSARIDRGFVQAGRSSARFSGSLPDFKKPEARLDVDADALDLDQLLPKKPVTQGQAGGAAPPGGAAGVPVRGTIQIDRLTKDRLTLTHVTGQFDAGASGIHLKDFTGQAYDGQVGGNLDLTPAPGGSWDYGGNIFVIDASAADLLAALTPIRGIEGRLRTRALLSGRNGPDINSIKALTLTGMGLVLDGAFVNIPAVQKISQVLKFKEGATERVVFKAVRHHVEVKEGFVVIDTLKVSQLSADWDIGGRIGLDGALDCPVTAHLDPAIFQEGSDFRKAAEILAGPDGRLALTFHLGGSVKNPDVSVNLDPLVEAAKKSATGAVKDELRKRLGGFLKKP
jgi:hypothetical protein